MSTISLSHISKEYKRGIRTVEDFSLEIGEHEFCGAGLAPRAAASLRSCA
jgi:ABC-type Fe3+/spermidine/putrescine transport system ATPase subunit